MSVPLLLTGEMRRNGVSKDGSFLGGDRSSLKSVKMLGGEQQVELESDRKKCREMNNSKEKEIFFLKKFLIQQSEKQQCQIKEECGCNSE